MEIKTVAKDGDFLQVGGAMRDKKKNELLKKIRVEIFVAAARINNLTKENIGILSEIKLAQEICSAHAAQILEILGSENP